MPGTDFLQLDASAAPHHGLADWLTSALRTGVADGRLAIGAKLPASRALAEQLGVSRGVVVEAYRRLTDEGLLSGRRGGGTSVSATVAVRDKEPTAPAPATGGLDLSPGLPDLSSFPRQAWLRAEREVLAALPAAELGYGDPRGTVALREALSAWLSRTRGIRADPAEIVIVNGVAQGLSLLMQTLYEAGTRTVAFEDPGSAGTRDQVRHWGHEVVPVPVDDDGIDVDALRATGAAHVVVTPAHQYPTGVVLGAARRRALVQWARDGGLVVEDDYDAEHRYDRPPVAALQPMAPDHVVHFGTVSKTLAPALRIGWMIAPAALRAEIIERKRWSDMTSPALGQLTLARMITTGAFERHLRLVRARHRERRDALLAALDRHLPTATVHGVAAGLHLMVVLPDVTDDVALVDRARELGVLVHPLAWHRTRPGPAGLVVGYAASTPDRITEGVRRIAAALE
ncbi:MocR-like pyridoxine biosynthesis transcription factor PdxR [Pseudonocardia sp. TRM90224]|uniref:MocR-like pyridoxine biosynthesis transcription factor PdxR n=1 Tax=Pseudonocardia sp. TRM90224 TaxID=2812678 RepID=UPI001E4D904A|nr:PLP-dependent aminotransferase family protein [Pseudonocardia sp. TRM90224]